MCVVLSYPPALNAAAPEATLHAAEERRDQLRFPIVCVCVVRVESCANEKAY